MTTMNEQEIFRILKKHRNQLSEYGVKSIAVFGSVVRDEARSTSDVDILIDFDAKKGLFAFLQLKQYLEEILQRKVDLTTRKALHPELRDNILEEAVNAY